MEKGRGKGSALVVLGKADSERKHGGLGQGPQKVIITAARAAHSKKGSSDHLPDLGSDPWSSGGEDDLNGKTKPSVSSKMIGKGPRPLIAVKAPRKQVNHHAIKKPHKYRADTVALHEIRRYQRGSSLLLWKLSFARYVWEVSQDYKMDLCFQPSALMALQEAS